MTDWQDVSFSRWETPIENDDLLLVDLVHGDGSYWVDLPTEGLRLEMPPSRIGVGTEELIATFLSIEKRALFTVSSSSPEAYRVLDEAGLMELWFATEKLGGRPGQSTFIAQNHAWQRESELIFFKASAGGSFVVATGFTCLEIVAAEPPIVRFVRNLEPRPL